MKVLTFAAGLAAGYVLGSRAGRETYEQIVSGARKAKSHPTVVQAQEKAKDLLSTGTDAVAAKVSSSTASSTASSTSSTPASVSSSTMSTPPSTTGDVPVSLAGTATTSSGRRVQPKRTTSTTTVADPLA